MNVLNLFNTKYFDSVVVVFSLRISAIRDFYIYIYIFFLENKLRQNSILPISFVSSERMCRYAATDAESSVSFYFHFL